TPWENAPMSGHDRAGQRGHQQEDVRSPSEHAKHLPCSSSDRYVKGIRWETTKKTPIFTAPNKRAGLSSARPARILLPPHRGARHLIVQLHARHQLIRQLVIRIPL